MSLIPAVNPIRVICAGFAVWLDTITKTLNALNPVIKELNVCSFIMKAVISTGSGILWYIK